MSVPQEIIVDPAAIKELQLIEASLSDVDVELTAKQYLMTKDVFAQRQQTIAKIPAFWAVVFGNASTELDAAISERDSELLTSLTALEVTRPEIPASAKVTDVGRDKFGEPRSFTIRFQFQENEFIADSILEKTFYFRYTKGGGGGLTSTPVKINWKPGKDLANGLSDAAYALWEAQRRQPNQQLEAVLDSDARKARDAAAKELPEYKSLAKTLHDSRPNDVSFFTFFSYRGRWTSAAESQVARAELNAKRQAAIEGKPDEEEDDGEDDDDDEYAEDDVEVFPLGHDVAITIAEDIWPSAIDYFLEDSIDSDDDLDGIEIDDDDNEDEDVEMS